MNINRICDPERFIRKRELSCNLGGLYSSHRNYKSIITDFNRKSGNIMTKKQAWQELEAMFAKA